MSRIPPLGDGRRLRVGLLGGSFNPAHAGHLQVARLARARLQLDQVWLLVSPGNPLKPKQGMAPLAARLATAEGMADGRRIVATDIERVVRTRYTVDTIRFLQRRSMDTRRSMRAVAQDVLDGTVDATAVAVPAPVTQDDV